MAERSPAQMIYDRGFVHGIASLATVRREADALLARAEQAEAAIERARAIHVRIADNTAPKLGFTAPDLCRADGETWPCPTAAALGGPPTAARSVEWAEGAAAASTVTGHTVGCTCYGCERVRALHAAKPCANIRPFGDHARSSSPHQHCTECGPGYTWPCPTIAALDGGTE